MKQLILLLSIVILAGCSVERRLARLHERYPIKPDTIVETHTVYETDTIQVQLPGDTVETEVKLEVPIDLPDTTIYAETDFAEASAGLFSNVLWLNLKHKDVAVPVEMDSVIVTVYQDRVINKPYPVIEKVGTFWRAGFLVLAGLVLISLILIFAFRRK